MTALRTLGSFASRKSYAVGAAIAMAMAAAPAFATVTTDSTTGLIDAASVTSAFSTSSASYLNGALCR